MTSVTRPEFNTSYTYGSTLNSSSYGKLLSENSTNGTSRSFTYDALGRTATETEHADSTHWLRKTYAYNATGANLGSLASIAYTTQDGDVTTETFSYANGHNTGISIPGTTVFSLSAENALGQPTAVTTGTVNRTYGYTAAGLPALRTIARTGGAVVQNFSYSYNTYSGNLHSRTDIVPGQDGPIPTSEAFQYDSLNRLRHAHMDHTLPDPPDSISFLPSYIYDSISASYDSKGNILTRGAITNSYGNVLDPYAATASQWSDGAGLTEPYAPGRRLTMTSFDRPAVLSDTLECMTFASYEYDATGGKARASFPGIGIERRYLGGVFERDVRMWEQWSDDMMDWQPRTETVQRLFLGGTAYDAPMVLVKEEDGDWTPYNIGRDVQGSITHVLTKDGALLERYIYDPWGGVERTDSTGTYVDTLAVVDTFGGSGGGWSRIVGSHGYTGHEVIAGVGIINANARLYDPATGRFLSPDPLIQDPESTQNFNRYSYCLNNPLKYTDESGEVFWELALIAGHIAGMANIMSHGDEIGNSNSIWTFFKYYGIGFLSGAAGSIFGELVSFPSLGIGFLGAGASASLSGFASGFVLGAGNAAIADSPNPFGAGMISGIVSGATSFLFSGLSAGFNAIKHGGEFWTGTNSVYDCFGPPKQFFDVGEDMEYSSTYANAFSKLNYDSEIRRCATGIVSDGSVPDYHYLKRGDAVYKMEDGVLKFTYGSCKYLGPGNGSRIYLYKAAFSSKEQLYLTMGHEYLHAFFNTTPYPFLGKYAKYYEHAAIYNWQLQQATVWNLNVDYYDKMYQYFSPYMKNNPYSYKSAGFFINPIRPL